MQIINILKIDQISLLQIGSLIASQMKLMEIKILFLLAFMLNSINCGLTLNESLPIGQPSLIQWINVDQVKERLIIFDIEISSNIIASQNLVIPESFFLDYASETYQISDILGYIYDYQQIKSITKVQFIHIIGQKLTSQGSFQSNGQETSQLFSIHPSNNFEQSYHQNCSYIVIPDSEVFNHIYEIQRLSYSTDFVCNLLSPFNEQFAIKRNCQPLRMVSILESQAYIKQFSEYRISDKIVSVNLKHEYEQMSFIITLKNPNSIDGDHSISELKLGVAQNFNINAKWKGGTKNLTISIQNSLKEKTFARVHCLQNNFDYCDKFLIFEGEETINFQIIIVHSTSLIEIIIEGIQSQNKIQIKEDIYEEVLEKEINDNVYQEQTIEQSGVKIYVIILAISGCIFFCVFAGCCIKLRKRNKRKDDLSQSAKNIREQTEPKLEGEDLRSRNTDQKVDQIDFPRGMSDILPPYTQDELRGGGFYFHHIRIPQL